MAGYSGTPLVQKLGIKAGHRVAFLGAPDGFGTTLGQLPPGVAMQANLRGEPLDVIVLFAPDRGGLTWAFGRAARRLAQTGGLWVAWPKKASGVPTDLTEAVVQGVGVDAGLVDNKVCAIDDIWAGLRFVIRLQNR